MNSFWNIIEFNFLIIVAYVILLFLGRRLRFVQQRILLLAIPALAIMVISIKSVWPDATVSLSMPTLTLDTVLVGGQESDTVASTQWTWSFFYWTGVMLFALIMFVRMVRTLLIFRGKPYVKEGGIRIYRIEGYHSFSFLNRVQLSPELDEQASEIVLEHEKLHVQKRHSLDLIVLEFIHVFLWFNPIFFWVRNRLVNVHEYDVDEGLYNKYKVNYMHFLLNYALGLKSAKFVLSNPFFNQLTLKQRIMMMKSKRKFGLSFWLILPLIFGIGLLVQCTDDEVQLAENQPAPPPAPEAPAAELPPALTAAEIMPEFPGGQDEMMNFIIENVNYPEKAKEKEEQGTVFVSYVVGKEGAIRDISIKRGVSDLLDAEAKRVVGLMPDWQPGEQDGKKVAVEMTLPIAFRL